MIQNKSYNKTLKGKINILNMILDWTRKPAWYLKLTKTISIEQKRSILFPEE